MPTPLGARPLSSLTPKMPMAFGITGPCPRRGAKTKDFESDCKSLEDFRSQSREIVRQGIVDIMLLSASNVETLAIEGRPFSPPRESRTQRGSSQVHGWPIPGTGGRPLRRRREMRSVYGRQRLRGTGALQAPSDSRCRHRNLIRKQPFSRRECTE
jgi:hypothetical protein